MISRFRPTCPIIAMTPSERTARQLAMAWGIRPVLMSMHGTTVDIIWHAVELAAQRGMLRAGDLVGVLVGAPHESEPTTHVLRPVRLSYRKQSFRPAPVVLPSAPLLATSGGAGAHPPAR